MVKLSSCPTIASGIGGFVINGIDDGGHLWWARPRERGM